MQLKLVDAGPAAAVVLAITALAVTGAVLTIGVLDRGATASPAKPATPASQIGAIGQALPTSFGAIAVGHADRLKGLTPRALAGVTHAIHGLVRPDQQQIEATVALTSLVDATAPYTPDQFRMLTTKGKRLGSRPRRFAPVSGTLAAGVLQPGASVEGRIGFVVPRDGSQLWLQFTERSRGVAPTKRVITIDLGRSGTTAPGTLARLHYH